MSVSSRNFVDDTMLAVITDYQRNHKIDLARETSPKGHKVLYWLPSEDLYQVEVRLSGKVEEVLHASLQAGFDAWRERHLPE